MESSFLILLLAFLSFSVFHRAPTHAVIDKSWADGTWSGNIPYDYAILVVPDQDAFTAGYSNTDNPVLDDVVTPLEVDFTNEQGLGDNSLVNFHGYSANQDPNFRYCRQEATSDNGRWRVPGCMLSGGASGGPCQPNTDGNGKLFSIVSYKSSIENGGPRLDNNSFSCLFEFAKTSTENTILAYGGTPCPIIECTQDADCDNGIFCDGPEKCVTNSCTSGVPPCTSDETCNEAGNSCDAACTVVGPSCGGLKKGKCGTDTNCIWCSGGCFEDNGCTCPA